MRAWTFTSRGPPAKILTLQDNIPQPRAPDLQPDEVLVKVSHSALFGPMTRLMSILPHFNNKVWIPNFEFSGTVVATSTSTSPAAAHDGATRLKPGDAVFGMFTTSAYFKYNGALAEYIIVPAGSVVAKPKNAKMEEAAGLAGGGSTAIGLAENTGLLEVIDTADGPRIKGTGAGKRVLITGASTATGMVILQLARYLVGNGGEIVTTASPRNRDAILKLGADEVIDYTKHPDLHRYMTEHYSTKQFDVIIDVSGTDPYLYAKSPGYLKPEGPYAFAGNLNITHSNPGDGIVSNLGWLYNMVTTVAGWALNSRWPVLLGGVPRRSFFYSGQPNLRNMELVRQLVEDGKMSCVVDSVWTMDDALKALDHLNSGKIRGKVVVQVSGS